MVCVELFCIWAVALTVCFFEPVFISHKRSVARMPTPLLVVYMIANKNEFPAEDLIFSGLCLSILRWGPYLLRLPLFCDGGPHLLRLVTRLFSDAGPNLLRLSSFFLEPFCSQVQSTCEQVWKLNGSIKGAGTKNDLAICNAFIGVYIHRFIANYNEN